MRPEAGENLPLNHPSADCKNLSSIPLNVNILNYVCVCNNLPVSGAGLGGSLSAGVTICADHDLSSGGTSADLEGCG